MRVLIYGIREQGKSTLALCLALKARGAGGLAKRVIIFDPNAVYQRFYTVSNPADFQRWLMRPHTRIIVYRPTPGRIGADFQDLSDVLGGSLWDYVNYVLLVDEAAALQDSRNIHPALERYLRQAPPSIDVIQTMHRQVDSSTLGRTLVTDTIFFYTDQIRELKLAEDQFGDVIARELPHLQRHHFLHTWTDGGYRKFSIVRTPARWYTPIGFAPGPATGRTASGTASGSGAGPAGAGKRGSAGGRQDAGRGDTARTGTGESADSSA